MKEQDPEEAGADPRYDITEDGKLVPHSPDNQDFDLQFNHD
jgi:hypothetical protein